MTTRHKNEWRDDPDGDGDDAVDDEDDVRPGIDESDHQHDLPVPEPDDGAVSFEELPDPPTFEHGDAAFDPDVLTHVGPADVAAERDEYRDALFRVKADFENYKKRIAKDHAATVERAAEKLVSELLPVLDACEAAIGQGLEDVEPIYKSLMDTLEKGGLVRVIPIGEPFDPNLHEAVMHEPSDDEDEHTVIESLRTGYAWNGRVLRPAMVKVRG
jgi:molecular chaperone GrpE